MNLEALILDVEDYAQALGSRKEAIQLLSAVLIAEAIKDTGETLEHTLRLCTDELTRAVERIEK